MRLVQRVVGVDFEFLLVLLALTYLDPKSMNNDGQTH